MYKKKEKAKKQKFRHRRDTIPGPLNKKSVALPTALWRLGCKCLTTKYLYGDRHYESPNLELLRKVHIFRHDKHLNFYRTVNIWRLIFQKLLNYKYAELWQKPEHTESESYVTLNMALYPTNEWLQSVQFLYCQSINWNSLL
jgi:hypothetical protein